jgi:hypothetical protein
MNSVNQKINELDEKILIASKQMDDYENENYKTSTTDNKDDFKFKCDNSNFLSEVQKYSKINSNYRKKLDKRIDAIMDKIDNNINSKYSELSSIISNYKTISHSNKSRELNQDNNKIPSKKKEKEKEKTKENENEKKTKNNSKEIGNIKSKYNIIEDFQEESEKDNDILMLNRSEVFPTKVQIICKRENEISKKIIKKNKFLENEVNYLKYKLNNVQKQKEFLQGVIQKDKNINQNLLDIFVANYFEKIAQNWKDISDEIINELIIDEIHELAEVKLNLRNRKREEEKEREKEKQALKNEEQYSYNINQISPIEMEEFILFNENLKNIKKVIRSVKLSERDLCKKYKIKMKNN